MIIRKVVWCLFFLFFVTGYVISQCNTPNTPAGLFCDPDLPNGAPLLCELDCLNGYTAMMPPYDDMASQDGQPSPLCDSMNGGQPNNMSWFAFIAGSETIRFEIIPFDCSGGQSANGVQAGIYGDCEGIEKLYCESEAQENTFEIGGPGFVMGRVYYFFIDGFEGSQCMYTVNVLEGDQPFPLPDFQFSSDEYMEGEILCTGGSITTSISGLGDEEVSYEYSINPPTENYPSGSHPTTDDSIAFWTFPESGTFEVCVRVSNGCDVSSNTCMIVTTDRLQNETFADTTICLEDLNAYTGPQSVDPNGDGIIGWQGSDNFLPGLNIDTVTTPEGCSYIQHINLDVINPGNREQVTIYTCEGVFPVTYEGMTFDQPVDQLNISIDNGNEFNCDSLVELTIAEITLDGEILIEDCENAEALLNFVITEIVPANYDSIRIVWTGINDEIISDPDGSQTSISVSESGIYGVEIIISKDNNHCAFSFDSDFVDLQDLRPSPPAMIDWLVEPCENRGSLIYRVNRIEEAGVTYQWSYPSDAGNVVDTDSDSLIIDWGSSTGGTICVEVTNSCGTSDPSCQEITIISIPQANIFSTSLNCSDENVEVFSDGDASWIYEWDFDDGIVTSSEPLNGPGPHLLEFGSTGIKEITLVIQDGDCLTDTIAYEMDIIEQLAAPEIDCISTDNSIIFYWDDIPGAVDYEATINTSNNGYIDGNSFVVEGLMPDDQVTLELRGLAQIPCAHSIRVSASCAAGCDDIGFGIDAGIQEICSDFDEMIALSVSGNIGDAGVSWEGDGVTDQGIVDPGSLGIGDNTITANAEIMGCLYRDSISIFVYDIPQWDYELIFTGCEEVAAEIFLNPSPSAGVYQYFLDGDLITEDRIPIDFGTVSIEALDDFGCRSTMSIDAYQSGQNNFEITGPLRIKDNEDAVIETMITLRQDVLVDSVVIYGTADGVLCIGQSEQDCQSVTVQPMQSQSYCLEIFYNDGCYEVSCFDMQVVQAIELFTPNIFSPNDDGNNDRFRIMSSRIDYVVNKIRIFDRWGGLVFSRDNADLNAIDSQWDGMISTTRALPGVYLYIVEFLDEDGEIITESGSVTLIR